LEAAARQLDEAIRMLFQGRDIIAVHTVAAAAEGILDDVAASRRLFRLFDFIRPERQKEFREAVRRAQNFFKHADRNPNDSLDFSTEQTHHVIFNAVLLTGLLGIQHSFERGVFAGWYFVEYPDVLHWDAVPNELRQFRRMAEEFDPLDPTGMRWVRMLLGNCEDRTRVSAWGRGNSCSLNAASNSLEAPCNPPR
jgi:hypothetical protein